MYLRIFKNGIEIDHREIGVRLLSFKRNSLNPKNSYDSFEGRHGLIPLNTTFDGRKLNASFLLQGTDYLDFQLKMDRVHQLFSTEEEMYVIDSRQPGKQWKVKVESEFSIDLINSQSGRFQVSFLSALPYAVSLGTTQDPFTFESGVWQIGQGLIFDDLIYTHTSQSFSIYNAGDVTVDPRVYPLLITYKGSSTNLEIKNTTTAESWKYTGTTNASDIVRLDGLRSTKNSLSIFGNTNLNSISIAPGWNQFELLGTNTGFEISFNFRFYYI